MARMRRTSTRRRLLSHAIVTAPNAVNPFVGPQNPLPPVESFAGVDQQFRVDVGPPDASLSVSVVDPKPELGPPRATVLVLHGFVIRSVWMMGTARMLADAGYRTVLVDLRGQGGSTGRVMTYGVREAQDLSQVIDALEQRRLIAGRLGVYGYSYGASVAIHLAGRDPRVGAVVAVAPFSSMRDEVPHYLRTVFPVASSLVSKEKWQEAIDEAGRRGGFDPDEANALTAIRRTAAPVLLIHGAEDHLIPSWHSMRLNQAAPDRSRLVILPETGHISIWYDAHHEVADHARRWFDRWLIWPA